MKQLFLLTALFLSLGCPKQKCEADPDCDDQNPCTEDICNANACQNNNNDGLVPEQTAADDCLTQACQAGAIVNIPNDGEQPPSASASDCVREVCSGGQISTLPADNEIPAQIGAACLNEVCSNGDVIGEPAPQGAGGCNANEYCDADAGCQPSLVDLNAGFGSALIFGSNVNANLTNFTGLAAGDLTGDGTPDIAASEPDNNNGLIHIIPGPHNGAIDLATNPGITITGALAGDRPGLALASCDFNDDGDLDLVLSASGADPNGVGNAGVLFGVLGPFSANVDLAAGADLTINGVEQDAAGPDKILCADINRDGKDDIIASFEQMDAQGRQDAGEVFIFFGGAGLTGTKSVTQADITVQGHSPQMRLGGALALADLDDDQIDDLIIGAPRLNPNAQTVRPEKIVVVFGDLLTTTGAIFDLADPNGPPADAAYIDGGNREQFAFSLVGGDFDGDAIDDIAIGALLADPLGRQNAGEIDIVYGQPGFTTLSIDAEPGRRTTLAGFDDNDETGISLAAGDHNGDGLVDLLVGAHTADGFNNLRQDSGEAFLFLGGSIFNAGDNLDLRTTAAGIVLFGRAAFSSTGKQLQMFDMNNDGKADMLVGAPLGDGPANSPRQDAGEIFVIRAP